jgi:hypothetical protein
MNPIAARQARQFFGRIACFMCDSFFREFRSRKNSMRYLSQEFRSLEDFARGNNAARSGTASMAGEKIECNLDDH